MGIEDIQISEELETNAPSIKYRGNEGPKSPQEMEQMMINQQMIEMMAGGENNRVRELLLKEETQGLDEDEKEELRQLIKTISAGGQPLPSDPTKPVNPFQPKPTGPVLPDRQMAAYGGIMGMDGRRQYGIGSSLKKFARKIIPNEVAEIAVKAAPFVAPFNAPLAGLMAGVGSFDQTGRIGSSLKSGLGTYAQGKILSGIGGGGYQGGKTLNPFNKSMYTQFTSPIGTESGIGKMFKENFTDKLSTSGGSMATDPINRAMVGDPEANIYRKIMPNAADIAEKTKSTGGILKTIKDFALDNKLITGLAAGTLGATALMGNMEADEIQDLQRGEGLDIEGIRTEVIEAMKDSSGEKLKAIRIKYPFLGNRSTKDIEAMGKAMGGRIGFDNGGGVINPFNEFETFKLKNLGYDVAGKGTEPFGGESVLRDILRVNRANGGRMGFEEGGGIMMASSDMGDPKENAEYYSQRMFGKPYKELNADELEEFQEEMRRLMNKFMSNGGRINRAEGGIMDLGGMEKDYRAEGGFVPIGREEKADDVPARLSVNEFVFTADAVRNAGGGDIDQGAQVMENMMKHLEQGGQVSEESQGMQGARDMFATSQRLNEVI